MKLAERVQKIKPSPTIAVDTKAKEMKANGIDVIGFGAGEPDFDTPEHIKAAAVTALKEGKTKYTPVAGVNELKDAILAKVKKDNGLDYTRAEVTTACGGKQILYNAAQALFEEGDEVIIPSPYWVSYPDQVLLNDAEPVILQTQEENEFRVRPEELEAAIGPKTKAFILNSPSNPTGSAYPKKELEALAKVLVKREIFCISDEVYEKIVYDKFKFASIASLNPEIKALTLTCNALSKTYSMTGWRVGYAVGPGEIIAAMNKVQSQSTSHVTSIAQWAAVEALKAPQDFLKEWIAAFQKRRDVILAKLRAIPGVTCFTPQGAFYVFPNISSYFGREWEHGTIKNSNDLADYLLETVQVAVVPGIGFGAEGFIRLSYATSMANIETGVDRIAQALAQLS